MLKFKQTAATKSPRVSSSAATSLSNPECSPCKASVIIQNIVVPLVWPASEYFDHKGEWREFNACLSLKAAGGKLMRSKIHQRVNRTITDLRFDENFTFHDLDPDFTIEALVSAKRIDTPRSSSSPFQSVANTVSRSFGRRFGANYKKLAQAQSSYTISAYNFPSREEIFSSPVEDLIPVGRCFFRLENAGLSGKVRVYSLALVSAETIEAGFPSQNLLPLFGTICCQVLCRPDCLETTLVRSVSDIFYVDEQLLLEKLDCALEAGCVKCYTKDKKEAALVLPIDQNTTLHQTAYQTAVRITLVDEESEYTRDFIFILANRNQVNDWEFALRQQIANASAWKEFASTSTNPFALQVSNEFKKPIADFWTEASKTRTMTNTDEIRAGLREVSKRGSRQRVQSLFKDPSLEKPSKDKPKPAEPRARLPPTPKATSENVLASPSVVTPVLQKPKIVESRPASKPQIVDLAVRPKSPQVCKLVTNPGYVSSPTKTSPRVVKRDNAHQPPSPYSKIQKPIRDTITKDVSKNILPQPPAVNEKPKQNVRLEYQEDTVEAFRDGEAPKPHRVSNSLVEKHTKRKQKPDSVKVPANTYVIRLQVGADDDNSLTPRPYQKHTSDPTKLSKSKDKPPSSKAPPPPYQPRPHKEAVPLSNPIHLNGTPSKPRKYSFETEVTRL